MNTFQPQALLALAGPIYLLIVSWPLARIDISERRLPNRLVVPAFPIALTGQLLASMFTNHWDRLGLSLALGFASMIVGIFINRTSALGMGDVKLIAAIVLSLSWFSPLMTLLALAAAFLAATLVVLYLLIIGKSKLGATIALGPYLLFGFAGSLFATVPIQMLG